MSAIAELRRATWPSHQRLEKRINFKARLQSVGAYRAHVERMWGFYVVIEPSLTSGDLRGWLPDCDVRRKVPLLERDLAALGAEPSSGARLPRCGSVPACDDIDSAFGCAYVLEGATLGGRSLMPLVEARLGLTAESGAAFLASYGDAVEAKWRAFGEAIDRCCSTDRQRMRAAEAASATFSALEIWLCGDHP
jgi:heme oxygenase